jgi:MiaB/RimO family radical SAM methylthiotransferase
MKAYLEKNGWQIADTVNNADLILFNACALTQPLESNSIHLIQDIKKHLKDNQRLIVWGCLPKIDPETLLQTYQDISFGEREVGVLDEVIEATTSINDVTANEICKPTSTIGARHRLSKFDRVPIKLLYTWYLKLTAGDYLYRRDDPSIFYIKIATGCLGNCSYCAVKKSRGNIKSKPIDQVMDEFKAGLSRGFKEFSLLGTDLGPYGRDLGGDYNLVDLLTRMVNEEGDFKIGIRNIQPLFLKQMINELVPVFATGKIWFTGVPIESGSDRILKLMKRGYSIGEVKEGIQRLKEAHPDLFIQTQIMVNFPTETRKDFAESLSLFDQLDFDYAEIYAFSPRPGTVAADMEGRIPGSVAYFRELRMITKGLSHAFSRRFNGGVATASSNFEPQQQ